MPRPSTRPPLRCRAGRHLALGGVALVAVLGAGCGGDDFPEAEGDAVLIELESDVLAGGLVRLDPLDDRRTRVVVSGISGGSPASGGKKPVHVRRGSCDDEPEEIAWELEPATDEESDTVVDASLDELLGGDYAIDVHVPRGDVLDPDDPGPDPAQSGCAELER